MNKSDLQIYRLIAIGHLWVNLPVLISLFGIPLLAALLDIHKTLKIVIVIFSIIGGFATAWLLWSILVTKWRIWAFTRSHEDNWPRLKALAIKTRLIWDDDSVFEQTEWRSEAEHRHITGIYERIAELEEIEAVKLDLQTPDYYAYGVNKRDILAELLGILIAIIVAIGLLISGNTVLGILLLALAAMFNKSYRYIRHVFDTEPGLVLSNEGVYLRFPQPLFIPWDDMDRIVVVKETRQLVIVMDEDHGFEKRVFDLYGCAIRDYDMLLKRVRVFIGRFLLEEMEDGGEVEDW